ncbi:MAG: hypothetical protein GY797_26500, partial [Deltaproteobacteria bacterium]|nr:hypothetical protein [Deltaproteobacteria bacterium]
METKVIMAFLIGFLFVLTIQSLVLAEEAPDATGLLILDMAHQNVGGELYRSAYEDADIKIKIQEQIINDAAIQACIEDLSTVLPSKPQTVPSGQPGKYNFVLRLDSESKLPMEAYTIENRDGAITVTGGSVRGLCYGVYFLREQLLLGKEITSVRRKPDFTFRMITQPFEVAGYPDVATLTKPIVRQQQFGPMRPFDGAGYNAEDEARNILRSGLNTIYLGSYSFASTYDKLDQGKSDKVFPKGSKGRKWVEVRRNNFRKLIAAAEKYHLDVAVNSDIFAYPHAVNAKDKWKAMETSLTGILTDFPEIDYVLARFGENYTYWNPFFTGEGPENDDEMAKAIDKIHSIVVTKFGKKFMPRTWSMGNDCWHAKPSRYLNVIKNIKAKKDIYFSIKNTQTDFWRYNRFNPCIGIGDKLQAVEYLCQDGYNFKNAVPYYDVTRMARGGLEIDKSETGMKKAKELGVKHTWGWLTADGWCGPKLTREEWLKANLFGYTHLMWDVNEDPAELAQRWAA